MRYVKWSFLLLLLACLVLYVVSRAMDYYPLAFGKKIRVTVKLPPQMQPKLMSMIFRSDDCVVKSRQGGGEAPGTDYFYGDVTYDAASHSYSADLPFEHYTFSCTWYPSMIAIDAIHPDAYDSTGKKQSITIAYIGTYGEDFQESKQAESRCRWFNTFTYTDKRVPHLACYNPDSPRYSNDYSVNQDTKEFFLNVEIEEKEGGGFFDETEKPNR